MPAAFSIRVLDSIIRIEIDGSLGAEEIEALQSPWRALQVDAVEDIDATVRVTVGRAGTSAGSTTAIAARDPKDAAQSLASALTLEGISKLRGRALLLHAAGIALDDGRVVGFIGPSGRGKTTASRELSQRYGYVTDETLAIRSDLSVIPYPKPLSVLQGQPPKLSISPDSLGMRPLPARPLRLAALVLLHRRAQIHEAFVEQVDLTDALASIAPETSSLVALRRPLGELVDAVQRTGGARRVVYAEAADLADLVPEILDAVRPPESVGWIVDDDREARGISSDGSHYRRLPFCDAVRIGDRMVIHNGSRVIVLEGLGPALWSAADGRRLDQIIAGVTRDIPPPPGIAVEKAIAKRLADMVDAGLLFRE